VHFEGYLRIEGKMAQVNKYGALSILTPRARGGLFENGGHKVFSTTHCSINELKTTAPQTLLPGIRLFPN
jgi:hypothetical protein